MDSNDSALSDKTADQIMIDSIEFSEEIERAIVRREGVIKEEEYKIVHLEAQLQSRELQSDRREQLLQQLGEAENARNKQRDMIDNLRA